MELQARLSERTEKGWSWICLIQEPYVVRGNECGLSSAASAKRIECKSADPTQFPHAIIYHHPKANITPCPQFTGRDVAVGIWQIGQPDLENILLVSLFWSREAVELLRKCLDAVEWAAQNQIPVHVGGDLNAHSKLWGNATDTARGFRMEKLLFNYVLMCTKRARYLCWLGGKPARSSTSPL